jgi:hypothetical protein
MTGSKSKKGHMTIKEFEKALEQALDKAAAKDEQEIEDKQFCACGNYKMDESDFCEDCI